MSEWEVDFFSRPLQDANGRKRWELLVCETPRPHHRPARSRQDGNDDRDAEAGGGFRYGKFCPAETVNSLWLGEALQEALQQAVTAGRQPPRRLRCWRQSLRTMVQRASEPLGIALIPSRRCYALIDWLQERQRRVYPRMEGYLVGPLAPPTQAVAAPPVPLPEAARGHHWEWASLPLTGLEEADTWPMDFAGLIPLPMVDDPHSVTVPGIRLFAGSRALAVAGWLSGLELVRLVIGNNSLVLEAGIDDRWLLANLDSAEATAAAAAFQAAREQCAGLQFLAGSAARRRAAVGRFLAPARPVRSMTINPMTINRRTSHGHSSTGPV